MTTGDDKKPEDGKDAERTSDPPSLLGLQGAWEDGLVGCQPHTQRARPQPMSGPGTQGTLASLRPQTQLPIIALPAADTVLRAICPLEQDKRAKLKLGSM